MSRVSLLPLLSPEDVEGTEFTPVVKDGALYRAPLDGLAAGINGQTAGANLLFDSAHEVIADFPRFGGFVHWPIGTPAFTSQSENIPVSTPVATIPAGSQFRRTHDLRKLGLQAGQPVTLDLLVWFAEAGGQCSLYLRETADGANVGGATGDVLADAGLQVVTLRFDYVEGADFGLGLVTGGGAFEVAGMFLSPTRIRPQPTPGATRFEAIDEWLRLNSEHLAPAKPRLDQTGFAVATRNRFDPAASGVAFGQYVNEDNGQLAGNADYNSTGFMPVEGGGEYTLQGFVRGAWFDAAGNFLSGYGPLDPSVATTLTAPAIARLHRGSARTLNFEWHNAQFEKGAAATDPIGFNEKIAPYLIVGSDSFGERRMRKWRMFKAQRALGYPVQFHFAVGHDSRTFETDRWSGFFTEYLVDKYGDAGAGWIGFGKNGNEKVNGNARPALYSVVREGDWGEADTTNYYTSPSPDIGRANTSADNAKITVTGPALPVLESVRLFWEGTADGVARYRWNGGGWNVIALQGAGGQNALLEDLPAGDAWTWELERVSGNCRPQGLLPLSAEPGVIVSKTAGTGTQAAQWSDVAEGTNWQNQIAVMALDGLIWAPGPNDQANQRTAALFAQANATMMARYAAACPGMDRMIVAAAENGLRENVKMVSYQRALAELAARERLAFLNMQDAFGDPNDPTEYGITGNVPLIGADNLHELTRSNPTPPELQKNAFHFPFEILDFLGAL
ncbi:hypothetical protein ABC955_15205 [Citromicrobium bathyomarinum]